MAMVFSIKKQTRSFLVLKGENSGIRNLRQEKIGITFLGDKEKNKIAVQLKAQERTYMEQLYYLPPQQVNR